MAFRNFRWRYWTFACTQLPTQVCKENGCKMMGVVSVALVVSGVCLAYASRDYPTRRRLLESCGGALLVLGLVALGFAFPFFD
jgi:hypothetical protein